MLNIDDFRVLPQIPSTLILIHRNPATARSQLSQKAIFVVSEQVLDASGKANIQRAAIKITNMAYWLQWLRLFVLDELNQKPLA